MVRWDQRLMIGESPHDDDIDGQDKSRRTSRLNVHAAALSECRVLSRLLRDLALQLGGLLRVLHAHRVRVEYRAPLLPQNGVYNELMS